MSQHDFVIDNADGRTVRTDTQAAVQALATCSSGTVEPAVKYPGMLWLDTSVPPDGQLRQRNNANNAWLPVLITPEMRFIEADMYFGQKTLPNRLVWNDKFDGSGTDVMQLSETGVLNLAGTPALPGDVITKGYVDNRVVPIGTVIQHAGQTAPTNYLKANGASLLRAGAYQPLFDVIGTAFGAVDSTHFSLPDLRGEFVRGWDDARGVDASRIFGSAQGDQVESHTHPASSGINSVSHSHTFSDAASNTGVAGTHTHPITAIALTGQAGPAAIASSYSPSTSMNTGQAAYTGAGASGTDHFHTVAVSGTTGNQSANHTHAITVSANAGGGAENRPRNIALLFCIKYQ